MGRKVANPLGLAVLAWLMKEPMHPYQLGRRLAETGQDRRMKYTRATLYMVVEQLAKAGFVQVLETVRDGQRPERTVYRITDAGRREFADWLRALLAQPREEFPQFVLALSFVSLLPPAEAVELLRSRVTALTATAEETRAALTAAEAEGHPWVLLVEERYALEMLATEIRFVGELADALGDPAYEQAWREQVGSWTGAPA